MESRKVVVESAKKGGKVVEESQVEVAKSGNTNFEGMEVGPWKVGKRISSGAFGSVYNAELGEKKKSKLDNSDKKILDSCDWVVKISEDPKKKNKKFISPVGLLYNEYLMYNNLSITRIPIPKILMNVNARYGHFNISDTKKAREVGYISMEKMGKNLNNLFKNGLSSKAVISIGAQIIMALEELHSPPLQYVYSDIKPQNFVVGREGREQGRVFMIDLGAMQTNTLTSEVRGEMGTPLYASIRTHTNETHSPMCDLESVVYLLIYLLNGTLPWSGKDTPEELVKEKQNYHSSNKLLNLIKDKFAHNTLKPLIEYVMKIKPTDYKLGKKVNYKPITKPLFEALGLEDRDIDGLLDLELIRY